jgi:exodeoxyribonuclease V alpha subunit
MHLDPSQERAVELVCTASFAILTGGPGTGKSTCLRVALDRMDAAGKSYALASPTGKAAKRMTEATGRPACTIHRLLGFGREGWGYHAGNTLPFSCIIIDESSMMDLELADALADALAPSTRIIFVGDANQLPSVGPGRILADLVESEAVPVARLTQVHRAAAESWICRNAPKVLAGESLELADCPDFHFVEVEDAGAAGRAVAELVAKPEYRGAQVLCPQKNTACGVEELNIHLQQKLNPPRAPEDEWQLAAGTAYARTLRLGDRLIMKKNNYKLIASNGLMGVFNGEVGEVVGVSPQMLTIDFGDRRVGYDKSSAGDLDLAYALTVHKSQGSEFSWVICVVHSSHTHMLSRHLFYTGITRAKKGVIIVGNRKGLSVATSAKEPPKRNTALVARMREVALEDVGAELGQGDVENDWVDEAKADDDAMGW